MQKQINKIPFVCFISTWCIFDLFPTLEQQREKSTRLITLTVGGVQSAVGQEKFKIPHHQFPSKAQTQDT